MTEHMYRRWFRFRLRTLLLVVTVLAMWLGYQKHWINHRRAYMEEQPKFLAIVMPRAIFGDDPPTAISVSGVREYDPRPKPPPGLLWLWGERGVGYLRVYSPQFLDKLDYHRCHPSAEAVLARHLFPEARIEVVANGYQLYLWEPGESWNWREDWLPTFQ